MNQAKRSERTTKFRKSCAELLATVSFGAGMLYMILQADMLTVESAKTSVIIGTAILLSFALAILIDPKDDTPAIPSQAIAS